jgi:hypothetical protein
MRNAHQPIFGDGPLSARPTSVSPTRQARPTSASPARSSWTPQKPLVRYNRSQLEVCAVDKLRLRALDLRDALGLSKAIPGNHGTLVEWILENQGTE